MDVCLNTWYLSKFETLLIPYAITQLAAYKKNTFCSSWPETIPGGSGLIFEKSADKHSLYEWYCIFFLDFASTFATRQIMAHNKMQICKKVYFFSYCEIVIWTLCTPKLSIRQYGFVSFQGCDFCWFGLLWRMVGLSKSLTMPTTPPNGCGHSREMRVMDEFTWVWRKEINVRLGEPPHLLSNSHTH